MGAHRPVETVVEDARWDALDLDALANAAAAAALAVSGLGADEVEIALLGADDARIAELNGSFRGKAAATNVLSWPALDRAPGDPVPAADGDGPAFLGDLALAFETCRREAEEAAIPLRDHVAHLVVHGVLHLLGHRHDDEAEGDRMEALEAKALATLGVPDPYGA